MAKIFFSSPKQTNTFSPFLFFGQKMNFKKTFYQKNFLHGKCQNEIYLEQFSTQCVIALTWIRSTALFKRGDHSIFMNSGHLPIHKIGPIRRIHSVAQARGCKAFEGILSEG